MIEYLPDDWRQANLVGRVQTEAGPTPVLVRSGRLLDMSATAPTTSELLALPELLSRSGRDLGPLEEFAFKPVWVDDAQAIRLLSPLDLHCVKASGVTFAASAIERVIEERAHGDASQAEAIRDGLRDRIGADLSAVRPGTPDAEGLKAALLAAGLWSQYLEVAIGPDAEIFTKAPTLSTVGWGDWVGVREDSAWNNPEPEIVLVCDRTGTPRGAALGNDVNLRDFEGRSALLLGKAKDNNASAAVGPFIRLFDEAFTMDDVRSAEVALEVQGDDNFHLRGASSMSLISRDPLDLVRQTIGPNHHYPDGFALYLGTMFAPIEDRGLSGQGFTHKLGDVVRVSTQRLGVLENKVTTCSTAPAWRFGLSDLMRNLASRNLLVAPGSQAAA